MKRFRNIAIAPETYSKLDKIRKSLGLPTLSISKTITYATDKTIDNRTNYEDNANSKTNLL